MSLVLIGAAAYGVVSVFYQSATLIYYFYFIEVIALAIILVVNILIYKKRNQ